MPKAAGVSKVWNDQIKYYGLLSTHHPLDSPEKIYITPQTEAFAALIWENSRDRWPLLFAHKSKNPGRITYVKDKSKKGNIKPGYTAIDISENDKFKGKYTKSDSGQTAMGGWSADGLRRYVDLVKINKEARKKRTTPDLENKILGIVRKQAGIKGNTSEEQRRIYLGQEAERPQMEEVTGLLDESDFDITEV